MTDSQTELQPFDFVTHPLDVLGWIVPTPEDFTKKMLERDHAIYRHSALSQAVPDDLLGLLKRHHDYQMELCEAGYGDYNGSDFACETEQVFFSKSPTAIPAGIPEGMDKPGVMSAKNFVLMIGEMSPTKAAELLNKRDALLVAQYNMQDVYEAEIERLQKALEISQHGVIAAAPTATPDAK